MVVLSVNNALLRSQQFLGRIVEVFLGKNGLVLIVLVKSRNAVFKRPIAKLFLILKAEKKKKEKRQ